VLTVLLRVHRFPEAENNEKYKNNEPEVCDGKVKVFGWFKITQHKMINKIIFYDVGMLIS
jgi:hypothetical protein